MSGVYSSNNWFENASFEVLNHLNFVGKRCNSSQIMKLRLVKALTQLLVNVHPYLFQWTMSNNENFISSKYILAQKVPLLNGPVLNSQVFFYSQR